MNPWSNFCDPHWTQSVKTNDRVWFNFPKVIRDFSCKNNCKIDIKFCPTWLAEEENFETWDLHLTLENFYKKEFC